MRRYELMLLLRPDLEDDALQSAVEKVTRAIVNAGGSLTKVSPWGKRRLAYDIKHYRDASYFLIHFDIEPAAIRELERGMQISEDILRHLVTVLEDRGPAEELAPAATPRGATGGTADEDVEEADGAEEATEAGADADDETSEDTSDDTSEDQEADAEQAADADAAPAPDEERGEG
ncbi:MAG TPA: 30S ribosomal protein S6 [Candidatus Limnocylindria bacterium]|jgi:small subunit ribosomal protein S6|nr:30S ribosomal protein S6 [Candidatus Limnocylindria bacterium]